MVELPYVDEHTVTIEAGADVVWGVLTERIDAAFSHGPVATFAGVVGCESRVASGPRPLTEGSTIPGFRVVAAVPTRELVLHGRHRFSEYQLSFHLAPVGSHRTRLSAETRAAFLGRAGRVYRLLVIGTGGHVVAIRKLFSDVKGRSEPLPSSSR